MRSASATTVLITLLGLSGASACDAGPDSPTEQSAEIGAADVVATRTRDGGPRDDAADALLAALGDATLACLGTVGPNSYMAVGGILARTFDACTTRDADALAHIDALLGVQLSARGQEDGLADLYIARWTRAARNAPADGSDCPQWLLLERINLPGMEAIRLMGSRPSVQKSFARYAVRSEACADGRCATRLAAQCASGFGDAFVVRTDARASEILVDPVWWLWNDVYDDDEDENPFETPGYYHPMSYYGRLPGDRYGSLARAGEKCSRYDEISHKHYIHYLYPIECSPGWQCMTYCM